MVLNLVKILLQFKEIKRIIVTLNIFEQIYFPINSRVVVILNSKPNGFGFNHNRAFSFCNTEFFCVLNPDISFLNNPFSKLIELTTSDIALSAPIVKNLNGEIEDNIRKFPTPITILLRQFRLFKKEYSYCEGSNNFHPEWVAGMFMLFRSSIYETVGGFDELYWLYVEDVDICTRIWVNGFKVLACPNILIFHDARRASRSNIQHLRWHFWSLFRYFVKFLGNFPKIS